MQTREILSIVALAALGLCLLSGLAKMTMKGPKAKQTCNHACSLSLFAAIVLLGVSQLLEEEGYKSASSKLDHCCCSGDISPGCKKCGENICHSTKYKYCAGKNINTQPKISEWQKCTRLSDCKSGAVCVPGDKIAVYYTNDKKISGLVAT